MANRPKHPCQWPSCPELLGGIHRYCPKHAPRALQVQQEADAASAAEYRRRPANLASRAFLNSISWQNLRREHLYAHPFCEKCQRKGLNVLTHDVHHVHPRSSHPHLALDPTNLESLCVSCHSTETRKEAAHAR